MSRPCLTTARLASPQHCIATALPLLALCFAKPDALRREDAELFEPMMGVRVRETSLLSLPLGLSTDPIMGITSINLLEEMVRADCMLPSLCYTHASSQSCLPTLPALYPSHRPSRLTPLPVSTS